MSGGAELEDMINGLVRDALLHGGEAIVSPHHQFRIRRRLDVASSEVSGYHDYDYVIVNDELDVAVDALRSIVMAERARVHRMRPVADAIINTFPKRDQD